MLDLLKDFCNCFLLWIKKRLKWAHDVLQVLETCQSLLHNLIDRIWIHFWFSVSLKSPNNYFFRRSAYKSLLNRFSVLINYIMLSYHFSSFSCFPRFSGSRFFKVQLFQGPGYFESRFFRVRVQVLEVAILKQFSILG